MSKKFESVDVAIKYQRLFDCEDGQVVLDDLMKTGNFMDASYVSDSHAMAFNEGMRYVVTRILQMINTDPEKLRKMIEKQHKDKETLYEHFRQ